MLPWTSRNQLKKLIWKIFDSFFGKRKTAKTIGIEKGLVFIIRILLSIERRSKWASGLDIKRKKENIWNRGYFQCSDINVKVKDIIAYSIKSTNVKIVNSIANKISIIYLHDPLKPLNTNARYIKVHHIHIQQCITFCWSPLLPTINVRIKTNKHKQIIFV